MAEIDILLQTVMFTLYGNQYESREEHLLLTMFQVRLPTNPTLTKRWSGEEGRADELLLFSFRSSPFSLLNSRPQPSSDPSFEPTLPFRG